MPLKVGDKALDFLLASYKGERYSLYETSGYALLTFYKVTCPTCQLTLPFVEGMYRLYGDKITFWGIVQDSERDIGDFTAKYNLTFPQLVDHPAYEVSQKYIVEVVPTLYLINPERIVEFVSYSFVKREIEELNRKISSLVGKEYVDVFADAEVPAFNKI